MQTLKGFRDFLPDQATKREWVIGKIKEVFAIFGFDPLETPALEYAETLMGKYGTEADKLMYLFKDNGGRNVGLRYDQTVPLSRVVAQYQHELVIPFKRYQMQPVWRAENTQKGRYREFLQCDIDTIGSDSPLSDAEIIACSLSVLKTLGCDNVCMVINDRAIFDDLNLSKKAIIIIDKLDKIGKDEVIRQLNEDDVDGKMIFDTLVSAKKTDRLEKIFSYLTDMGFEEHIQFRFTPFLARGLDYYTSTIFELKVGDELSLAGGGRYDQLIGQFSGTATPAVGLAFGFDRLMEYLQTNNLLPEIKTKTTVLVTIFSPELVSNSIATVHQLREARIAAEIPLTDEAKLDKQLKYADKKGIPYVLIQGPEEIAKGVVQLKNMKTRVSRQLSIDVIIQELQTNL